MLKVIQFTAMPLLLVLYLVLDVALLPASLLTIGYVYGGGYLSRKLRG